MLRCNKCILPYNYPGINFNDNGECNFCSSNERRNYKGSYTLKKDILSYKKTGDKYDCVIGFSGGRDSTFLLYYLKKRLDLKILALAIDNGHVPATTWNNIYRISKYLDVELIVKKYDFLERCLKVHFEAWLKKPNAAMVSALCVGCKLGISLGRYEIMKKFGIPVYISGGTPFEGNHYKTNLLRANPNDKNISSLLLGYIMQIKYNRCWIKNPITLITQGLEFFSYYFNIYDTILKKRGYVFISPFKNYIRWDEREVINTIKNIGWKRNESIGSTWRGDCDIALLRQFLYLKLLGFNDKDDSLSDLIRDRQISREQAIRRLKREQSISDSAIKSIIEKNGFNYNSFASIINGI